MDARPRPDRLNGLKYNPERFSDSINSVCFHKHEKQNGKRGAVVSLECLNSSFSLEKSWLSAYVRERSQNDEFRMLFERLANDHFLIIIIIEANQLN